MSERAQGAVALPDVPTKETYLSAHDLVRGTTDLLASLEESMSALEATLAESICTCDGFTPDGVWSLQKADHIRQSLKDAQALVSLIPIQSGCRVTLATLRAAVDMRSSLSSFEDVPPSEDEADDGNIWL